MMNRPTTAATMPSMNARYRGATVGGLAALHAPACDKPHRHGGDTEDGTAENRNRRHQRYQSKHQRPGAETISGTGGRLYETGVIRLRWWAVGARRMGAGPLAAR